MFGKGDIMKNVRCQFSSLIVKFVQKWQKNLIKGLYISNIKMKNEKVKWEASQFF
jgi:hypothetical protein